MEKTEGKSQRVKQIDWLDNFNNELRNKKVTKITFTFDDGKQYHSTVTSKIEHVVADFVELSELMIERMERDDTNIWDWTKDELKRDWIDAGKPCVYRYGWGWKGAGARTITKERALELLPKFSPGKGFYELDFITIDGVQVLEFNELSENDMW